MAGATLARACRRSKIIGSLATHQGFSTPWTGFDNATGMRPRSKKSNLMSHLSLSRLRLDYIEMHEVPHKCELRVP